MSNIIYITWRWLYGILSGGLWFDAEPFVLILSLRNEDSFFAAVQGGDCLSIRFAFFSDGWRPGRAPARNPGPEDIVRAN
jgi:hypothetical protein